MKTLLLSFLLFTAALPAAESHKLTVSGSATIHKPADKMSLSLGVVTTDKNVETAIKANNDKMQEVINAIVEAGLSDAEFQTGNFTVTPQYSLPPKNPPSDWQSVIVGYEIRNTINIDTNKLPVVGQLITQVVSAGANFFEDISFSLQDIDAAQTEAIGKAVQRASLYAEAAANEAEINLGAVIDLTINSSFIHPKYMKAERVSFAAANSTPINPGNAEVTASVTIVYEITQVLNKSTKK